MEIVSMTEAEKLTLDFEWPLQKEDLVPPHTLIQLFKDIRNLLAGRARGVTLDQTLVSQLIDIIACKVYDEVNTPLGKALEFQRLSNESEKDLYKRICSLFVKVRKDADLVNLFSNEELSIEPNLLSIIVEKLQPFELSNAKRDAVGEAFEVFIGSSIRGNEGQFFTPRNIVELACAIVNPKNSEYVVDPACGTGGFLLQAIKAISEDIIIKVIGVDKDVFLSRIAAIQLILMRGNHQAIAVNADSLYTESWPSLLVQHLERGTIDVIITNPPFGSRIGIDADVVKRFDLGYQWKKNRDTERWAKTDSIAENRPPQILFIEHCLNLLKPGGRLAIVLPDGVLGNENQGCVRQYMQDKADVVAIIDLPIETFLPSTSTKTSLLVLRKKNGLQQKKIFMAIPEKCGHDRRGKTLYDDNGNLVDDLPEVAVEFRKWSKKHASDF